MSVDLSDPTSRRESLISFSSCSTDPLPRDTTLVASLDSRTSCCTRQVFSSGAWIKCAVGVIGIGGGVIGFVLSNIYGSSNDINANLLQPLAFAIVILSIGFLGGSQIRSGRD